MASNSPTSERQRGPRTEKNQDHIALLKDSNAPVPWSEEFEKMISGMSFDPRNSAEMLEHQLCIKRQLAKFNNPVVPDDEKDQKITLASLKAEKLAILKNMLGKIGDDFHMGGISPLFVVFGCNVRIGNDVSANRGLSIHDHGIVTIGHRVQIGPNVQIITEGHGVDVRSRREGLLYAEPITIGDDCWIGAGVIVLGGVNIGRGCTIGAGAVVSKDIPELSVAVGVPAKVIRRVEDPDK
ncbi:hypothetical protein B7463_g2182, partial [Scytalidium lignicola]